MNNLLFYTLIILIIYFVFFHKSLTEKFNNDDQKIKSKKLCSQKAINNGILDYIFGGLYTR